MISPATGIYNFRSFITSALVFTTGALALDYLGYRLEPQKEIDPSDWKRKWLIFFAYIDLVIVLISMFYYMFPSVYYNEPVLYTGINPFVFIFPIITNVLILVYLGPTFNNPPIIDPANWKRKWIVCFAWLSLILRGLIVLLPNHFSTSSPIDFFAYALLPDN